MLGAVRHARRPRPYDVDELLATAGLSEPANDKIASLSGGLRRRLDAAIGIAGRPDLLFLTSTVGEAGRPHPHPRGRADRGRWQH